MSQTYHVQMTCGEDIVVTDTGLELSPVDLAATTKGRQRGVAITSLYAICLPVLDPHMPAMTTLSNCMLSPSNLMDRIPNELLAEIREVSPLSDLIFQVRVYQVFERAATFYHSEDKFWFQLCRINGADVRS